MTKQSTRLIAALVLAISAATTANAQAQAQTFNFGFGFGGPSIRMPHRLCLLTDSQLRRAIAEQGYREIFLNVANDNRIQARASRGKWVYLLTVNSCTGTVLDRERLRRR